MRITKLGHCCLLIEENGLRILTDPGNYSTAQNEVTDIDVVLITHEHPDHIHVDSLKAVLKNNSSAEVITNKAVAELLTPEAIPFRLMTHAESLTIKSVLIEALESPHAEVYPTLPRVLNTGFFIANKLFYPGDALIVPSKPVEVLACPVAGPWVKLAEALDYARAVKPKKLFPVHDGGLSAEGSEPVNRITQLVLGQVSVEVIVPILEEAFEV